MVSVPKPPPAPDPVATAQAQGAMNKDTAIAQANMNAINQYGPDGSLTYDVVGMNADGTPIRNATQRLSTEQARLKDLSNGTSITLGEIGLDQARRVGSLLATPYDISQGAIDARVGGMAKLPNETLLERRYTNAGDFAVDPNAPSARYTDASAPVARYTDPNATPNAMLVGRQNIDSNAGLAASLFASGLQRLGPQMQERRDNVESLMANKGLTVGSTGYERGMRDVTQGENDALNQLYLTGQDQAFNQSATRANTAFSQDLSRTGQFFGQGMDRSNFALGANSQNYGQDLSGKQFSLTANNQNFAQDMARAAYTQGALGQNFSQTMGANAQNFGQDATANEQTFSQQMQNYQAAMAQRASALQEISAGRNQSLNEIAALASGSQVTPQNFVNTPQTSVQPINYTGLVSDIYKGQISGYQAENQARQASMNGLGSIFGAATSMIQPFKLSDARLKTDVVLLGRLHNGLGVYEYRFKAGGPREIGVMAQEVARKRPDAVISLPGGWLAVDYARATEV